MSQKKLSKISQRHPGISGKYRRNTGKPVIYLILLVAVVIVMVILNHVPDKPAGNSVQSVHSQASGSGNQFTKEGELVFYQSDSSKIVRIDIEIADDDAQREKGLMFRRHLDENHGMLFIFAGEEPRSFWMKNTWIPLDIIYLNGNKRVVKIWENTTPLSEISIPSEKPAQYVLEVNAGFCARYGITKSAWMVFSREWGE